MSSCKNNKLISIKVKSSATNYAYNTSERAAQLNGYVRMREILGTSDAAQTAAGLIRGYFEG